MNPRKALGRIDHAERRKMLSKVLDAAARGDPEIVELADALARQFPHLGRKSILELFAKIGWLLLEHERD